MQTSARFSRSWMCRTVSISAMCIRCSTMMGMACSLSRTCPPRRADGPSCPATLSYMAGRPAKRGMMADRPVLPSCRVPGGGRGVLGPKLGWIPMSGRRAPSAICGTARTSTSSVRSSAGPRGRLTQRSKRVRRNLLISAKTPDLSKLREAALLRLYSVLVRFAGCISKR